jgi:D-alanine transaminase
VFASAKAFSRPPRSRWNEGYTAVTVPDRRWSRVDVKTIALVANVLAQQAAVDAGADDVIQVRDGMALEGAHSNLFAVFEGTLVTAPANNYILHGITRGYLLELARELGLPVEERPFSVEELARADEVFFSGTSTEVRPVVRVDGRMVADGRPGPNARLLYDTFEARVLGRSENAVRAVAGD